MDKNRLWMVLLVMLLASCSSPRASTPQPAPQTPALMTTNPPTIPPTATMSFTPTPMMTATAEVRFMRQCVPIDEKKVALDQVASGTILFYIAPPKDQYYLKDLKTGIEYKLPSIFYSGWGAPESSPDRKMLAMIENVIDAQRNVVNNILWVIDVQSKIVSKILLGRNDLRDLHWLDNDRLIIATEIIGNFVVINPFTREKQMISNDLPNLETGLNPWNLWRVVYSPNLEWVIYYGGESLQPGPIVRDLVTKKNLWQAKSWKGLHGDTPTWSPDGQEVAVVIYVDSEDDSQLYLINRSGQSKATLSEDLMKKAHTPSWSPDGHYFAFWNADTLLIYDRQSEQMYDFCISDYGWPQPSPPLWAPDSKQVLVNQENQLPILIDLEEKIAYKIQQIPNSRIITWMNSQH